MAPTPTIGPEKQLANVAAALVDLAERKPWLGQLAEIRKVAARLKAMADAHAKGELAAIPDDGTPF